MTAVGERGKAQIEIEKEGQYQLNLFAADLNGADLKDAHLTGADLMKAQSSVETRRATGCRRVGFFCV